MVFFSLTPKRGMKGYREQTLTEQIPYSEPDSRQSRCNTQQRSVRICAAGPSCEVHLEEPVTRTFPDQTELEPPALWEHSIATQGFPFMICFFIQDKIVLVSLFILI